MIRTIPDAVLDPAGDTVFELRRYTLKPGRREVLVGLFDAEFIETQEAAGMSVIGQFRDPSQPQHFVWFRGFADHALRDAALQRFYGGPAWAEHGPAANATMIDSDDVLMLKPAGAEFAFAGLPARPGDVLAQAGSTILVATHHAAADIAEEGLRWAASDIAEAARAAGAVVLASLVSDHSPNGFPRLPVRTNANVVVTVVRPRAGEMQAISAALAEAGPDLGVRPPEIATLEPTARSRLR